MKLDISKRFAATLATVAGLLGMASADAAVYTGVWDPPYGAAFPDLGWKGQASFFVPATCIPALGTGIVSVFNGPNGCDGNNNFATVQSAQVGLYSLTNSEQTNTLTFHPDSELGWLQISELRFIDGRLFGLQTTESDEQIDDVVAQPETAIFFTLQFLLPQITTEPALTTALPSSYEGPLLTYRCCDGLSGTNDPNLAPTLVITEVPEPGSLALGALGLAAIGWGRRRFVAARQAA